MLILFLLLYAKVESVQVDGAIAIKEESKTVIKDYVDVVVNLNIINDLLTDDDHSCLKTKLDSNNQTFKEIVDSINSVKEKEFNNLLSAIGIETNVDEKILKTLRNERCADSNAYRLSSGPSYI